MNAIVPINQAQPVQNFTMSDMERVALAIAKGGLFGSNDPNAVLTLCMLAHAEGQHPAVVFRDYHIIQGKPAKKAEAMHRDFLAAGGNIEWHRCDDECADATFSHPQGGSMRISWDDDRVKQAELGGNKMHKKFPRQMKRSRVISEGVRSVFPMATSGLYEAGEVQDIVQQDGGMKPSVPQAKRARDMDRPALTDESDPERTNAEQWVEAQLMSVTSAEDADALATVMETGGKGVAKLAREHPDLHSKVQAAYENRTAELNGYAEGPADADRSEPDTDHPASAKADQLIADAGKSEIMVDLAKLITGSVGDLEAMPDDMADDVKAAFDAAEARIKPAKADAE